MSRRLGIGLTGLVLAILLLPAGILIIEAHPATWSSIWAQPSMRQALWTTLGSGAIALSMVILVGTPTAWVLARLSPAKVQNTIGALLAVPLLLPPLVLGLVLAFFLGIQTPVGNWLAQMGISGTNSWFGLIVAEMYEALPYYLLTAWAAFSSISPAYEEELRVLGKSRWAVSRYVTWPMARPGLTAAAAMAWARITGAFGAPIVVAYHPTAMPVAIWIALEAYGLPTALALAAWLLLIGLPIPVWLNWRAQRVHLSR